MCRWGPRLCSFVGRGYVCIIPITQNSVFSSFFPGSVDPSSTATTVRCLPAPTQGNGVCAWWRLRAVWLRVPCVSDYAFFFVAFSRPFVWCSSLRVLSLSLLPYSPPSLPPSNPADVTPTSTTPASSPTSTIQLIIWQTHEKDNQQEIAGRRSSSFTAASAATAGGGASKALAPCASDIAPGGGSGSAAGRGDGLGLFFASNASASAIVADVSNTTAVASTVTAAAPATTASTLATATTATSSSTSYPSDRPPNVLVDDSGANGGGGGATGAEGPGAAGGVVATGGGGDDNGIGSDGQQKKPLSQNLLSIESLSVLALGSFSPATR